MLLPRSISAFGKHHLSMALYLHYKVGFGIGLKHYWGSNEEQEEAQTCVFSQLAILGQPSHFFIIIPNSASNYLLHYTKIWFL